MVVIKNDSNDEYIQNIKSLAIPIIEISNSKSYRFDASVYCTEGREARIKLKSSTYPLVSLTQGDGLVERCLYPNRFKRIYVDKRHGIDFYLPSQINEVRPKPNKYISQATAVNFEELKASIDSLLLTRSGIIGNLTYVSNYLNNKIFSDDVIRIYPNNITDAGFIYAFLKSTTGQTILTTNNYGAVVQHIEPSHLAEIYIPNPPSILKEKISDLITQSFKLRDKSNNLLDRAQKLLIEELKLPPLETLPQKTFSNSKEVTSYIVSASNLHNRFDGSYHVPIVDSINDHIAKYSKVLVLGDREISKKILLPGRFKRTYVDSDFGIPFFGGKQIYELDPSNKKYLSKAHHTKRFKEQLELKENMVLVTCSGTIGKVNIVPKHWDGWAANQHIMRIVPANIGVAGYVYVWLDSEYGHELMKKHTYGAVVDEIDDNQLSSVCIPLVSEQKIQQINDLALEANKKRYEAYILEREAINILNTEVLKLN